MNGFLNILKPPGMTSAAVVAVVRRLTGEKRVGHAGTLDPQAAGILPVMIGRAARLFDYLVDKQKTYVAEVAFGCSTDTQDATGTVLATGNDYPTLEQIRSAAAQLTGDIVQRPSMYSAIKQNGTPLYVLARRGEEADVPERLVHVSSIEVHGLLPNHGAHMTIHCGKGTYIRSICHDMGTIVGCPAHMRFLLRSQSGVFDLSTAYTLEELTAFQQDGTLSQHLLPLDMPIQHLPSLQVPVWMEKMVRNGSPLPVGKLKVASELPQNTPIRVYWQNQFWGIASLEGNTLTWKAQIPPDPAGGQSK